MQSIAVMNYLNVNYIQEHEREEKFMTSYYENHQTEKQHVVKAIISRVFAWMALAVAVSGAAAFAATNIPAFQSFPVMILLFALQLGIVILLSSSILSLSYYAAQLLFLTYALLTGFTFSVIFITYQLSSIVTVFIAASVMFGIMALYGAYTRTDLSQARSLFMMALVGLIIVMLINLFLQSTMLQTVTSAVGVLLFAGLTAFDMQLIKNMASYLVEQNELWEKITILCALQLYLDFINLFLSMLQLTGRRK
jgi:FtsH-binding integral membrane protein